MAHERLIALLRFLEVRLDLLLRRFLHILALYRLNGDTFAQIQGQLALAIARNAALFALIRVDLLIVDIAASWALHRVLSTVIAVAM